MKRKTFLSNVFPTESVTLADTQELIVRGGRDKLDLLVDGFNGINQIGVIGWGSQGPAQAPNLRDSLKGSGIKVKVGLRAGSSSAEKARAVGFAEESGTLGEMYDVIHESDLVILLISDAAQVQHYKEVFGTMKPKAVLGLSHGFLLGYLESVGETFPDNINVIGVCPKGMGPSVRRLYEQGSGINCSFAVERNIDGDATDIAIAWAMAIGAPYIFQTTLGKEWRSDLTGERGILLGGVQGIVEGFYRYLVRKGMTESAAFRFTAESITGPISEAISKHGILGLYNGLLVNDQAIFDIAFFSAYKPFVALMEEIYDEVASGNEIRSVIMAGQRDIPMRNVGDTRMWKVVAEGVRSSRGDIPPICPETAGFYVAGMMAQVDVLRHRGHSWSEIANESIIEATDSLNPYMHKGGISHMVDNCSTTARLGARRWAPQFEAVMAQQVLVRYENLRADDNALIIEFKKHPIHEVLAKCQEMRPPIDIAVVG